MKMKPKERQFLIWVVNTNVCFYCSHSLPLTWDQIIVVTFFPTAEVCSECIIFTDTSLRVNPTLRMLWFNGKYSVYNSREGEMWHLNLKKKRKMHLQQNRTGKIKITWIKAFRYDSHKALTRLSAHRGDTHEHNALRMTDYHPAKWVSAGHLAEPVSDGPCCCYSPSSASHHTLS